jgi:hypothetical protein
MRTRLIRGKFTLLFMMLGLLLAVPAIAFAQDVTGSTSPLVPTIQSDKADYAPGELVTLTGSGWQPGESVNIVVNDDVGQTWNRNVNVIADASGNITDQFNLPNMFVATYSVTATGASGAVATSSFTDGQLTSAVITTRTATGTPPSATCDATNAASFASGSTVCAHVVATLNSGGSKTEWQLKWFAPGVNINSGTPAQETSYSEDSTLTSATHDDFFVPTAVGTWTLVACKTGNTGGCAPGNVQSTQTFAVTKPKLTVTCDNKSRDYGDANPTLTATISGFQGSDTQANSTTGAPSCSTAANATSSVSGSPYTITASQGSLASSKYDFTLVNGNLTVNKAPLTVTANDDSREYGAANPTFTANFSGFKNGENLASSGVTGSPSLTTTATATSSVSGSPYAITAAVGTLAADNYSFTYQNGSLTVTKAPLTVKANDDSREYGNANPAFTANFSGFKNSETLATSGVTGSPSLTTTATPTSSVAGSPYAITAALGTLASGNYSFTTFVDGKLSVNKTTLTVTADNKFKILGAANPNFTASYSGFKNGETLGTSGVTGLPSLTTTADQQSPVGSYTITAAVGSLAANNYSFAFQNGTLKIGVNYSGFLQPINDTAHQIGTTESKFKLGQTIPVKFIISNAAGTAVQQTPNPTFTKSQNRGACDPTTTLEDPVVASPDNGTQYIFTGGQYHYNWSTKGLTAGEYRIYANLANLEDGTINYVDICLTK